MNSLKSYLGRKNAAALRQALPLMLRKNQIVVAKPTSPELLNTATPSGTATAPTPLFQVGPEAAKPTFPEQNLSLLQLQGLTHCRSRLESLKSGGLRLGLRLLITASGRGRMLPKCCSSKQALPCPNAAAPKLVGCFPHHPAFRAWGYLAQKLGASSFLGLCLVGGAS